MATIREVILVHHQKADGTWNVKIRVTHGRKISYIETQHYVGSKQIRKDFTIKDPFIIKLLNPILDEYRSKISDLGTRLQFYNAKGLAAYLQNGGLPKADEINVIDFGREQIQKLKGLKRNGSAANMVTVVNSLVDYFKSEFVPVTEIRAKMLLEYEDFLRTPRIMIRLNQFKRPVQTKFKGLADNGLHNHMRDLKILFNDIVKFYNDEDLGVEIIKHNPYKKYKLVDLTPTGRPTRTVEQLKAILNCKLPVGSRILQARDLFLLSFYLCGINAVDLYQIETDNVLGKRLDYNRSKTKRRKDKAFISVDIPKVAEKKYIKYIGELQERYSTHNSLDRALSIGLQALGAKLSIPNLEFMDARRMFASFAFNICGCSKDHIGMALNHQNKSNEITEIYITKDWSIIDKVQSEVIKLIARRSNKFLRWKIKVQKVLEMKFAA